MEFELENSRHEVGGESRGLTASERKKARQRMIERYLDQGAGACWLQRPEVAQMAVEALKHFNGIRYELDEWVIMPNHIHLVLLPLANHSLSSILHSRKRLIAREANKLIGKTGESFWQPESYDHWIRSDEEMARIKEYVRQNPVKGRLCESADEWPWGSACRNAGKGDQETID
ncbi:transposase [Verrucomicrobium spinosum]|uniref:transposase n=1 Tax=Verrucomicrobium spinosum TaxID=2736 RepID=UPI0012E31D1F|nr:transposase [Verrucomicrobium spinosum]